MLIWRLPTLIWFSSLVEFAVTMDGGDWLAVLHNAVFPRKYKPRRYVILEGLSNNILDKWSVYGKCYFISMFLLLSLMVVLLQKIFFLCCSCSYNFWKFWLWREEILILECHPCFSLEFLLPSLLTWSHYENLPTVCPTKRKEKKRSFWFREGSLHPNKCGY